MGLTWDYHNGQDLDICGTVSIRTQHTLGHFPISYYLFDQCTMCLSTQLELSKVFKSKGLVFAQF